MKLTEKVCHQTGSLETEFYFPHQPLVKYTYKIQREKLFHLVRPLYVSISKKEYQRLRTDTGLCASHFQKGNFQWML